MHIVGITGASGSILGIRFIEELLSHGKGTGVIVSDMGKKTIEYEVLKNKKEFFTIRSLLDERKFYRHEGLLEEFPDHDFFTPPASGTTPLTSVTILPCSMKTLGALAAGYTDTVLTRCVDVALKENIPCVVCPRETPLNLIHLENLRKLKLAGAHIVPPMLEFYTNPGNIDDMVNFMVGKILNVLKIKHHLFDSWDKIYRQTK